MILRFTTYVGLWGTYKGCAHAMLSTKGVRGLARKLWIDRNVLIPRLASPHENEMREALTSKLEEFSRLYFTSIVGLDSVLAPAKAPVVRSD